MSEISRRLAGITESATLAITARAAELRARGEPVIGYGAGEPDFPTPAHIVEAAQRAAADPRSHRYSPARGLPELREAVAEKTRRDSGLEAGPENVTITSGGKGAVFAACAALLDPGDEALVPAPYWVSYPEMVRLAGGVPRVVASSIDRGFKVGVGDLEAARNEKTKLLIFVSPSNPTGAVYTPSEVTAIGEWAAANGVWVIADEIYEHLVYGDAVFSSVPVEVPQARERCVVVNGVAKTFAMTGWRVGWMVAPPEVAAAAGRLQSHSTSNVANVSQMAALAAVTGPLDAAQEMKRAFSRRRDSMVQLLSAIPGVRTLSPDGAFYVFPEIGGCLGRPVGAVTPATSADYAEALLETVRIAVVPGEAFGAPGHLRLSFALGDDELAEGLSRWRETVS